jgi:hypothetical protein
MKRLHIHVSVDDPSRSIGFSRAFNTAAVYLRRRVDILLSFRMDQLNGMAIPHLNDIGRQTENTRKTPPRADPARIG